MCRVLTLVSLAVWCDVCVCTCCVYVWWCVTLHVPGDLTAWVGGRKKFGKDGTKIKVDEIVINPEYGTPTENAHNLAMLQLAKDWTGDVATIGTNPKTGDDVTTAGWGFTSDPNMSMDGSEPLPEAETSEILQKVTVQAISKGNCQDVYDITPKFELCAGVSGGGADVCVGDGGGPLVNSDGELVGVVSSGEGCGAEDLPGLYAKVKPDEDWVRDTIQGEPQEVQTEYTRSGKKGTLKKTLAVAEQVQVVISPGLSQRNFDKLKKDQDWFVEASLCGGVDFDSIMYSSKKDLFEEGALDGKTPDDNNCGGKGDNPLATRSRVKLKGPNDMAYFVLDGKATGDSGDFKLTWKTLKKASDFGSKLEEDDV